MLRAQSVNLTPGYNNLLDKSSTGYGNIFSQDGDSMTGYGVNVDANQIAWPARASTGWLLFLSNFSLSYPTGRDASNNKTGVNYGVSGDRTIDLLARQPATIADMKARKVGMVHVRIGTNNLNTASTTAVSVKSDIYTILKNYSDAGIEPIPETICPRTFAGSGLTAGEITTQKKKQHDINRYIRNLKNSGEIPLLNKVVDVEPFWIDPTSATGDPLSDKTGDGLHQNDNGGYYQGLVLYNVMQPDIKASAPFVSSQNDLYDATNNPNGCINANPLMTGTGGTAGTATTGQVADSYAVQRGSGSTITIVASKGTTSLDGKQGTHQIVTVNSGGTGAAGELVYLQQSITTNFSAGDVIRVRWPVIVSADTTGLMEGFRLEVRFEGGPSGTHFARHLSNSSGKFPSGITYQGTLGSPDYVVPAGTTTIRVRIIGSIDAAIAGNMILKAGNCSTRKI
jgi:lysophospholipase L1-like esterase